MSPEQALGEREVDGRSDLYSLAVVGYHMLCGETPFKAANTPAMLVKHVSERPRPIRERRPDVPAHLAVTIDRALAKRPEDRFSDAAEFREALGGAEVPPPRSRVGGNDRDAARAEPAPLSAPLAPAPAEPVQPFVPFPIPPAGLRGRQLREWYRAQRRVALSQQLKHVGGVGLVMNDKILYPLPANFEERPLDERVTAFRRAVGSWVVWTGIWFTINIVTHGPGPWFIIPSAFMFLNVLKKLGSIWSDGIGPFEAFSKGINKRLRAQRPEGVAASGGQPVMVAAPRMTPEQAASQLAAADVLAGPHGESVRRAASDRMLMREIAAALGPIEREMIPDIGPTVDALAERVGSVATTLHRLDQDVSGASLGSLDSRIASIQTEPDTSDRDRRLALLQRQRSSLHDLLERRRTLAGQLESASLMLQNLKLDMLKLRSSGLGTEIGADSVSATQEARALSREIGHVVQAAEDLRKL